MQVVVRSLLAATLVAWVASCSLNNHGLGAVDAVHPGAGTAGVGAAGAGAAGTASTGAAGAAETTGAAGAAEITGAAGGGGANATAGAGGAATGAAGDALSGAAGTTGAAASSGAAGAAGVGAAGASAAGVGAAGASAAVSDGGAGSATANDGGGGASGAAGGAAGGAPQPGCSDGTREGYLDMSLFPSIAACAGAWNDPGLTSTDSRTPQCDRRSGNDGDKSDGRGCSVADLCASGWSVCATAHAVSVATAGAGCAPALAPFGDKPVFFVTRQRANGLTCDANSQTGANNLYGCGNIGSAADKSCAPFTRMLRDSDCLGQFPWVCSDGPSGTATDELDVVTKQSSSRGGVLCCKN